MMMLREVCGSGSHTAASLVKMWNDQATKDHKIQGAKMVSLMQLLSLSGDCMDVLQSFISNFGWETSPLSEDSLASKKILPNFAPRISNKTWQTRLKTSDGSFLLMMHALASRWKAKNVVLRHRMEKSILEEFASLAAFVHNVCFELQGQISISDAEIQKSLREPFINGDPNLETELRGLLLEKNERFVIQEISLVRDVMSQHSKLGGDAMEEGPERLELAAAQLENDSLDLLLKKMEHDKRMFNNYLAAKADVMILQQQQELEWACTRSSEARAFAKSWVAENFRIECTPSDGSATTDSFYASVTDFMHTMIRNPAAKKDIIALPVLSWVSPPTISAKNMLAQPQLLSMMMHSTVKHNLGLIIMPQFSYKKRMLWLQESQAITALGGANINFDHNFSLLFEDRRDMRDERPLIYSCRLTTPTDTRLHKSI